MQITNDIINEIRNKTDIIEIVSNYLPLTKRGKNYFGVCPFHDDHSPSMSVSPEKQIYTCFSCGATGNVFTFVSEYEHISFIEAVKLLGSKVGFSLEDSKIKNKNLYQEDYEIYNFVNKFYQNNIYSSLGKNALDYLEKRNINKEIIKKFEIGLSIQKASVTDILLNKGYKFDKLVSLGISNESKNDIFVNRIMFPLYDLQGNVVGFSGRIYNTRDNSKYVNTKETKIFKKSSLLYNYHRVREYFKKNDSIIIMEGFMDVIRASTIGVNNCLATMGTAFTKEHGMLIKKMTDNVILCFDGDSAGKKATAATIKILEEIGVSPKIISLEDNMDPDDYILKKGKEAFLYKINSALNVIDYKMNLLKNDKNLDDLTEVSKYVDQSIKELSKVKDDVLEELTLKKLEKEFGINYSTLKNKLDLYKKENKVVNIKIEKKKNINYNKYGQAERNLIYYMLKDAKVINLVEHKISYFPTDKIRFLSNEIISFYHKYGTFDLADFISFINNKKELFDIFKEITNMNLKSDYTKEEIEDYIYVISNYPKEVRIKELEENMKKETDPFKQVEILNKIMELKGVK